MIILINLSSYQSAIYEELSKLGFNVYDEVTENAKFPYVVIGDLEFEEAEYHFNDLIDINLNILIWSIWEGKKEVNDIAIACELASVRSGIPYICFFDGFRTSHEMNTIYQTELSD